MSIITDNADRINHVIGDIIVTSTRTEGRSHNGADPVLCQECRECDLLFFDPSCIGCLDILKNPKTSISRIFAILRQWVPQVQQNVDVFVKEIFARGAHVDDKDGLTDMTLLHYAAKSGANGVGDVSVSLAVSKFLVDQGVDLHARCSWTDMTALHYAVFFDIEPVVEYLLLVSNGENIDASCNEFDNGTSLHIGCSNLCVGSVRTLIKFGANPHYLNKLGKPPLECIPTDEDEDEDYGHSAAGALRDLLKTAMQESSASKRQMLATSTLHALGLELHSKVTVSGNVGILRFCGPTDFASGQWAGIELEEGVGKNDGSVGGICYFKCPPKHGVFAPLSRVHKYEGNGAMDMSVTESSTESSDRTSSSASTDSDTIRVGDFVEVEKDRAGIVRYIGSTKFAGGTWVGIEAAQACGRTDGTVGGVEYFQCKHKHGIFVPIEKVSKRQSGEKSAMGPRRIEADSLETSDANLASSNQSDGSRPTKPGDARTDSNIPVPNRKPKKKQSIGKKGNSKTNGETPTVRKNSLTTSTPKKTSKVVDQTFGADIEFVLKTGMSVFVNNEMGVVRYIGRVEFADNMWIGIELKAPNGKNDGMVENKRYFTCKPNHGLMVRPGRATCRGINCDQLIDPKLREKVVVPKCPS